MSTTQTPPRVAGEPAWEIARLFPNQGGWSVQEYFDLSDCNRLVEYSRGFIEVLPMPTLDHQLIVQYLFMLLREHLVVSGPGLILVAPYRVRVDEKTYREPDVVVFLRADDDRIGEQFSDGADLVVEVLSESNRDHDLKTKRAEYAAAGIAEYWVVDPAEGRMVVLGLDPGGSTYVEHGTFARGDHASSRLLPGLEIDVEEMFSNPR